MCSKGLNVEWFMSLKIKVKLTFAYVAVFPWWRNFALPLHPIAGGCWCHDRLRWRTAVGRLQWTVFRFVGIEHVADVAEHAGRWFTAHWNVKEAVAIDKEIENCF